MNIAVYRLSNAVYIDTGHFKTPSSFSFWWRSTRTPIRGVVLDPAADSIPQTPAPSPLTIPGSATGRNLDFETAKFLRILTASTDILAE
jgi:hypothetical protein